MPIATIIFVDLTHLSRTTVIKFFHEIKGYHQIYPPPPSAIFAEKQGGKYDDIPWFIARSGDIIRFTPLPSAIFDEK